MFEIKNKTKFVILTLDKRINLALELQKESYKQFGQTPELFIVGDGKTLPESLYDHIDINELPPVYTKSIAYPTWWERPNAYNAWLSHNKILKHTLVQGYENLLLFEDDAFIEKDFSEVLSAASDFLANNKSDMLYLGGYHRPGSWTYTENEKVIQINGSGGWHGVVISKHIIEELLRFAPIGPYDWICGNYIHSRYKCYAIYPSVISQRDQIHSYVENSTLNKPSRYER